jgi:hypothetical protein
VIGKLTVKKWSPLIQGKRVPSNILDSGVAHIVVYKVCYVWHDQIILCRPFVPTTYFVLVGFCYFGMMCRKVTRKIISFCPLVWLPTNLLKAVLPNRIMCEVRIPFTHDYTTHNATILSKCLKSMIKVTFFFCRHATNSKLPNLALNMRLWISPKHRLKRYISHLKLQLNNV